MPVTINSEQSITLSQLVDRKNQGFMAEATPHIGNQGMWPLAVAALGLTVKLIATTKGNKDNLFYPHCIIKNGKREKIACGEVLTTHNVVENLGVSVSDFHTKGIRRKYPSITTQSDWWKSRTEIIYKILEIINQHTYGAFWDRYVDANGVVSLRDHHGSRDLPEKIHRITCQEEGWITPNPVNLLCDMICGAMESGRDQVYMISGPVMFRYIHQGYRTFGRMDHFISHLYDVVHHDSKFDIPGELMVNMVPLACLTYFAVPSKYSRELDRKLGYLDRLVVGNKRVGEKEREKKVSGKRISAITHKRAKVFQRLHKPLELVAAEQDSGVFYTQHDLLEEKENIYIPEIAMNMPVGMLIKQTDKMHRQMRFR